MQSPLNLNGVALTKYTRTLTTKSNEILGVPPCKINADLQISYEIQRGTCFEIDARRLKTNDISKGTHLQHKRHS
jgi:hypothetical protein